MDTRKAHQPDVWRPVLCRLSAPLAAVALLGVFGLATPEAIAQQSQEAPQGATTTQDAPPPAGQTGAPAEGAINEQQFQDWMVRCGRRNEQGPEFCEMQQQQVDSEDRTILAVAVGQVPGTTNLGLLIILPLGILLPAGVVLQVDGGAEVPLQVDRCERQGCRIEMLLEPELLNLLKSGRQAMVFFEAHDPKGQRQRLGVPISLLGFTAALNEVAT